VIGRSRKIKKKQLKKPWTVWRVKVQRKYESENEKEKKKRKEKDAGECSDKFNIQFDKIQRKVR
jgi:hypothetical protein